MRSLSSFALLVIAPCILASTGDAQQAASTETQKAVLARRILVVTRAADMVVQSMEAAAPAQRQASPQLPPEFWDTFVVRARQQTDSLLARLVPTLVQVYSIEELRGLLAFYESPLGKRLIEVQPVVLAKSMEIGQQWGMELGFSVAQELIRAGRMKPAPD